MGNGLTLQELRAIINQWDAVESGKMKMAKLLCRLYNNPLHLAESSLDKPSYRDNPIKREDSPHRHSIRIVLSIVCVIMFVPAVVLAKRTGSAMPFFIPLFLFRYLTHSSKGSDEVYAEWCNKVDSYNWNVDDDYSRYISRTFDSLVKIHEEKKTGGHWDISYDGENEFDRLFEENLNAKHLLDEMLDDVGIPSIYRKRKYFTYLYNLLVREDVSTWNEAINRLKEELRLNPNLV